MTKTVNILGVTGSIGQATQNVILANPEKFDVLLITAHTSEEKLEKAKLALGAKQAILTSKEKPEIPKADITICAITGMAGLESMLQAIKVSNIVAIANKEPLVAAGDLVIRTAREYATKLLPIDSEHNAIYQVFDFKNPDNIEKVIITGSGGPFLNTSEEEMNNASVEQALKHPNWKMGKKITIDSATLANKALEIIEAYHLFNLSHDKIELVIHPQSVIHSMVQYKDGSILSQMGETNMQIPIAYVLGYPGRIHSGLKDFDVANLQDLTFQKPDTKKFPFIKMAYDCIKKGHYACVTLNAANEVAVESFLNKKIPFGDIVKIVQYCLNQTEEKSLPDLTSILEFDTQTRHMANETIKRKSYLS